MIGNRFGENEQDFLILLSSFNKHDIIFPLEETRFMTSELKSGEYYWVIRKDWAQFPYMSFDSQMQIAVYWGTPSKDNNSTQHHKYLCFNGKNEKYSLDDFLIIMRVSHPSNMITRKIKAVLKT